MFHITKNKTYIRKLLELSQGKGGKLTIETSMGLIADNIKGIMVVNC